MIIRRVAKMGKLSLPIDSTLTVLDVNQITLTVEQLTVAMNNVYESSYNRRNQLCWHDLYSVAFSVSATLFLTCLTTNFKDFSSEISRLNPSRMMFFAWIIVFLLFVFGIICVCWRSSKSGSIFVDRNTTVKREIDKLLAQKEEVSS